MYVTFLMKVYELSEKEIISNCISEQTQITTSIEKLMMTKIFILLLAVIDIFDVFFIPSRYIEYCKLVFVTGSFLLCRITA